MLLRATLFGAIIAVVGGLPSKSFAQKRPTDPGGIQIDLSAKEKPFAEEHKKGEGLLITLTGVEPHDQVTIYGALPLATPDYPVLAIPRIETDLSKPSEVTGFFPNDLRARAKEIWETTTGILTELQNAVKAFNNFPGPGAPPPGTIDFDTLRSRLKTSQSKLRGFRTDFNLTMPKSLDPGGDLIDRWDKAQQEISDEVDKASSGRTAALKVIEVRRTRHFTFEFEGGSRRLTARLIPPEGPIVHRLLGTVIEPQPPMLVGIGVFYDPLVGEQTTGLGGSTSLPQSIGMQANLKGPEILRQPIRPFVGIGYDPNEDIRYLAGLSFAADRRSRNVWLDVGIAYGQVTHRAPTSQALLARLTFGFSMSFWAH